MLGRQIVFYDNECATCHGVVKFILARPERVRERFLFLPIRTLLEHDMGQGQDARGRVLNGDSIVTLQNGVAYQKADAIFRILYSLGFPWALTVVFRIIPRFLLDFFYDVFARNRYRWFGKADPNALCEVPDPKLRPLLKSAIPGETFLFPHRKNTFLGAEWINLVFLNYVIPEKLLKPYLPKGVEFDLWQGQALASIVAFEMAGTMVQGFSVPGHEDFEEVNLRFYVKRRVKTAQGVELRRGVVFVKEIVPKPAIAWIARIFYNENYVSRAMSHQTKLKETLTQWTYHWNAPGGPCSLDVSLEGAPEDSLPGSLEEFITEHYWGYARQRNGSTVEYEVEHPRWPVWSSVQADLRGPIESDYGSDLAQYLKNPVSMCAARGSAVRVFKGTKIN